MCPPNLKDISQCSDVFAENVGGWRMLMCLDHVVGFSPSCLYFVSSVYCLSVSGLFQCVCVLCLFV